jgi:hypothetical protein
MAFSSSATERNTPRFKGTLGQQREEAFDLINVNRRGVPTPIGEPSY